MYTIQSPLFFRILLRLGPSLTTFILSDNCRDLDALDDVPKCNSGSLKCSLHKLVLIQLTGLLVYHENTISFLVQVEVSKKRPNQLLMRLHHPRHLSRDDSRSRLMSPPRA